MYMFHYNSGRLYLTLLYTYFDARQKLYIGLQVVGVFCVGVMWVSSRSHVGLMWVSSRAHVGLIYPLKMQDFN